MSLWHWFDGETGRELAADITPIHEIKSKSKYLKILNSMRRYGWKGRPIAVLNFKGRLLALTGSHRLAAATELGLEVPIMLLSGSDVENVVMKSSGFFPGKSGETYLRGKGKDQVKDPFEIAQDLYSAGYHKFARLVEQG